MAFTLTIAGADKKLLLAGGSLSISDALNSRNTCSFALRDKSGLYRPADGATVVITEGGATRFAGTIDEIVEANPAGTAALEYQIACVDYNQVADRHLVARVYENQALRAIVADIVAQDLAGEGITTVNVETGPTIIKAVFNYCTAAEAFNELSQLTGYDWNIDYDKDLHFFSRETNVAPFSLADTGPSLYNIKVQRTRAQYRNKQYLRAGMDLTDARTDSFKGDGKNKAFTLNYPCGKAPAVKVNGAAKTAGIKGVDTGKDWYWNKGEKEIVQDDAATATAPTDVIDVTYQGLFPIIIQSQDDQEIIGRANAEGGSGVYEAIESDENIDDETLATDKANSLLRRYGKIPRIVTFETDTPGLAAGQLITVNLTKHNLAGQFLIESVGARDVGGVKLRYSVKALDGEAIGGWTAFFQKLAASTRKFVIRENEVLMLMKSLSDVVVLGDVFSYQSQVPLRLEVGGLFCTDAMQIAEVLS